MCVMCVCVRVHLFPPLLIQKQKQKQNTHTHTEQMHTFEFRQCCIKAIVGAVCHQGRAEIRCPGAGFEEPGVVANLPLEERSVTRCAAGHNRLLPVHLCICMYMYTCV